MTFLFVLNFPPGGGNKNGHQRTEYVEEAIGQVGYRSHAEDGALRHTAGVPGHQDAGYGSRVLACAT